MPSLVLLHICNDIESAFLQQDNLTSAFGSSRKKKAMVSRLKNQLKDEVLEAAVGSALSHVDVQSPATSK